MKSLLSVACEDVSLTLHLWSFLAYASMVGVDVILRFAYTAPIRLIILKLTKYSVHLKIGGHSVGKNITNGVNKVKKFSDYLQNEKIKYG